MHNSENEFISNFLKFVLDSELVKIKEYIFNYKTVYPISSIVQTKKFKEKIKSRFRDEFTYDSFSEGEKMRIDLSFLFTWRAIAKMKNSASTNLLIMDEVFDSSLDSSGTEEFMKILDGLTPDNNTFVISHKGDQLYDKFHSVIKFEKHSNFSRIAK